jgi:hypothetical protein
MRRLVRAFGIPAHPGKLFVQTLGGLADERVNLRI